MASAELRGGGGRAWDPRSGPDRAEIRARRATSDELTTDMRHLERGMGACSLDGHRHPSRGRLRDDQRTALRWIRRGSELRTRTTSR